MLTCNNYFLIIIVQLKNKPVNNNISKNKKANLHCLSPRTLFCYLFLQAIQNPVVIMDDQSVRVGILEIL